MVIVSKKLEGQISSRVRTPDLRLSKQEALTSAPGPPPYEETVQKLIDKGCPTLKAHTQAHNMSKIRNT